VLKVAEPSVGEPPISVPVLLTLQLAGASGPLKSAAAGPAKPRQARKARATCFMAFSGWVSSRVTGC
jgi:hypothetical protein